MSSTIMSLKNFSKEKFKTFHPGGNIGNSLLLAKDIMVTGSKMPVIEINKKLKEALKIINKKKLGIVVVKKNKFIKGIITDGDIRRELKNYNNEKKIILFMSKNPLIVNENMPASKALGIMNNKKITSLLVVSDKHFKRENKILKGIIHIHSLLEKGIR